MNRYIWCIPLTTSLLVSISGCDRARPIEYCSEPSSANGFVVLKTSPQQLTLKLPSFSDIGSARAVEDGCDHFKLAAMHYIWHEGKLISESANLSSNPSLVPADQIVAVHIYLWGSGRSLKEVLSDDRGLIRNEAWRYEHAIPHKLYPLEYYPKAFWKDERNPPSELSKDHLWGVRGTTNPITGRPYTTSCSIPVPGNIDKLSSIEEPFGVNGYKNCRGDMPIVRKGVVINATIEVWSKGAQDLDHIYPSVNKLIENFIQGE